VTRETVIAKTNVIGTTIVWTLDDKTCRQAFCAVPHEKGTVDAADVHVSPMVVLNWADDRMTLRRVWSVTVSRPDRIGPSFQYDAVTGEVLADANDIRLQ
jgi:hypothetical protein